MNADDLRTIVVSVAKAGHVNQCLALCDALRWQVDQTVTVPSPGRMDGRWEKVRLNVRKRLVTAWVSPRLRREGRLRLVASGRASEAVAAAYRRLYGADVFCAFIGAPTSAEPIFDVAVVSRHALERGQPENPSFFPAAREVVWMSGVPVRGRPIGSLPDLTPPVVVALIGGTNKAYAIDPDRIVEQLHALAPCEAYAVTVVFSRRTPADVEQRIRVGLEGRRAAFIDRMDRAGFERAMGEAAAFLVTPDSISMTCEACATGRPVTVFDLACFDRDVSTSRFIDGFLGEGRIALSTSAAPACPAPTAEDVFAAVARAHAVWASSAGSRA